MPKPIEASELEKRFLQVQLLLDVISLAIVEGSAAKPVQQHNRGMITFSIECQNCNDVVRALIRPAFKIKT